MTSPVVPGSAEAERFIEQLERLSPPQWARVVAELLLVAEDRSEDFDHALTATRRRLYRTSSGGGGTLVSRAEGIVGKAFNRGHPGRSPVGALSAVHATRAAIQGLLARPFISPLDFALLYRPFNGVIPIEGLDPALHLVDHGASLTAKNNQGQTPLDVAMGSRKSLPETVALLRQLAGDRTAK